MRTKIAVQTIVLLVVITFMAGLLPQAYMNGSSYSQAFAQEGDEANSPSKDKRWGPPEEAVAACGGLNVGEVCSFDSPRGDLILGTCEMTRAGVKACVPEGGGPGGDRPPPSKDSE